MPYLITIILLIIRFSLHSPSNPSCCPCPRTLQCLSSPAAAIPGADSKSAAWPIEPCEQVLESTLHTPPLTASRPHSTTAASHPPSTTAPSKLQTFVFCHLISPPPSPQYSQQFLSTPPKHPSHTTTSCAKAVSPPSKVRPLITAFAPSLPMPTSGSAYNHQHSPIRSIASLSKLFKTRLCARPLCPASLASLHRLCERLASPSPIHPSLSPLQYRHHSQADNLATAPHLLAHNNHQ